MMEIKPVRELDSVFRAPPSKAHTLRALFIASLANGKSIIRNALNAQDQQVAARALSMFGAGIEFDGNNFIVDGTAGNLTAPAETVFTGDSGVTTRFIIPVAGLAKGETTIDGTERMRERPIGDLLDALSGAGVSAVSEKGFLPLRVRGGTFTGGKTSVSGQISSQFLSAMLIAAPYTKNGLLVGVEGQLKSRPYVDITIDCMREFGIPVVNRHYKEFFVSGGQHYSPKVFLVEGDYSSASYFFAAAAVTGGKARVDNLNPDSKQGDRFFLECLQRMGCTVDMGKESVAVEGGELKAISIDMSNCPDIVPTLAAVAAFAKGKTTIKNIGHLAVKESNRLQSIEKNLLSCGIRAEIKGDSLEITGGKPHAGDIEVFNDHRIAMAFAVMGLAAPGIRIDNPEAVSKSFPDFFTELERAYGG